MSARNDIKRRAVIYGGTGFVGSTIAETFCLSGMDVTCVSRGGNKPKHLQDNTPEWAHSTHWIKGNVATPDKELLLNTDLVVTAVGSPPLPTFSKKAYDNQYAANGGGNMSLLQACFENNVKHIIIISAAVPSLFQSERFAYYKGKRDLVYTAECLFKNSDTKVSIFFPSAIFGARHTKSGTTIPLDFLKYPSNMLQYFHKRTQQSWLKSFFSMAPVPVKNIAALCLNETTTESDNQNIHYFNNQSILDYSGEKL